MESNRTIDIKLSDLIKVNFAYFDSYRQGFLYYRIPYENYKKATFNEDADITGTDYIEPLVEVYQFTIPIDDIGNATLNRTEKAITLMRWIRKAHESGELIRVK